MRFCQTEGSKKRLAPGSGIPEAGVLVGPECWLEETAVRQQRGIPVGNRSP